MGGQPFQLGVEFCYAVLGMTTLVWLFYLKECNAWDSKQRRLRPRSWYWKGESGRSPCEKEYIAETAKHCWSIHWFKWLISDHKPDDRGNRSATGPCTARTQEYLPEEQLFEFRDQFYAERFKRSSPAWPHIALLSPECLSTRATPSCWLHQTWWGWRRASEA